MISILREKLPICTWHVICNEGCKGDIVLMQDVYVVRALFGGALIGVSASALLLGLGRVAGISGIFGNLVIGPRTDVGFRVAFLLGLISAGLAAVWFAPALLGASPRSLPWVALAGLLVGVGTRLGSGCTSGHGVCGISRLSFRSLLATLTFIVTGALGVLLYRMIGVQP
ncbi:MAG TPA: YeeE/YedE family protein [Polyangiaceae bacterium]|nr:YeeE/YedE family protein [Polyangiaceae bacterium]